MDTEDTMHGEEFDLSKKDLELEEESELEEVSDEDMDPVDRKIAQEEGDETAGSQIDEMDLYLYGDDGIEG